MARTIWKFDISRGERVEMPKGAKVLTVQVQANSPQLWAIVDPSTSETESRFFAIYGTGHEMPKQGQYIATFQLAGGSLVFHVFEVDGETL